jgi:hypothetical protein
MFCPNLLVGSHRAVCSSPRLRPPRLVSPLFLCLDMSDQEIQTHSPSLSDSPLRPEPPIWSGWDRAGPDRCGGAARAWRAVSRAFRTVIDWKHTNKSRARGGSTLAAVCSSLAFWTALEPTSPGWRTVALLRTTSGNASHPCRALGSVGRSPAARGGLAAGSAPC